jgi:formylmethanofuran dehydrogenase subunit E
MKTLQALLDDTASLHRHLCPRQVLGVRIGLLAGSLFGLDLPQTDKRVLAIVETYGCAVDGIAVATGCTAGHRTLRVEDYGKVAAVVVDTAIGRAVRIAPRKDIRASALAYAPPGSTTWEAQLIGYQKMPDEELLCVEEVELIVPLERIISRPGRKTLCRRCGEEINNEREVIVRGLVLCRSCAGEGFYRVRVPALQEHEQCRESEHYHESRQDR